MVQTKAGSKNNPWLEHLRRCAAEYQQHRGDRTNSEERSASGPASEETLSRKRVIGKKALAPRAESKTTMKVQGKQKDATRKHMEREVKTDLSTNATAHHQSMVCRESRTIP